MSWKARYVVLEATLLNGQTDHKLIHEDVFADEGSDPNAFFFAASKAKKVGVVGLSLEEDDTGRLHYSGALPDIWTESHE